MLFRGSKRAFSPRGALEWDSDSESAKSLAIRILVPSLNFKLKLGLLARIFCGRAWDLTDAPPARLAMLSLLTFVALVMRIFRGPGGKGRAGATGAAPRRRAGGIIAGARQAAASDRRRRAAVSGRRRRRLTPKSPAHGGLAALARLTRSHSGL